jgi:hypothetical protein
MEQNDALNKTYLIGFPRSARMAITAETPEQALEHAKLRLVVIEVKP